MGDKNHYANAPPQQQMGAHSYGQPQQGHQGGGYGQVMIDLNPWNNLNAMTSAKIKERVAALEAAIGWEQNNIYDITDQAGAPRFIAKENTSCFHRVCFPACLAECKKFEFDMSMVPMPGQAPPAFLNVKRPFTCTCLCLNRPVMHVTDKTTGAEIGSVENPWKCCDYLMVMKTPEAQKAIDVKGSCMQAGLWCPLPCGSCKKVKFDIKDHETQKDIGSITREIPSCCKFCFTDADNYDVEFGEVTDAKWKAMILSTALFLDFRYFSEGKPASTN